MVSYNDGANYMMGISNATLYAKWTAPAVYSLRDRGPAGGWIFYDKGSYSDGWRYLEAAPSNQTTQEWGTQSRDPNTTRFMVTGADGTAIGTGKQNTFDIIAANNSMAENDFFRITDKAAEECDSYSITNTNIGITYTDWFLPSQDELNAMYVNLHQQGVGGFNNGSYWSSSEYNANFAWAQSFTSGFQSHHIKGNANRVRAVRAF